MKGRINPMVTEVIDRKKFLKLDKRESEYLILDTTGLIANTPVGREEVFV